MNRNVFVRPDPSQERTASGIYLPASLQDAEKDNLGTIVKVGPGTIDEPMAYKKGDRVKFNPHAGQEISLDNEDLKMISDTDIYCLIEP